MRHILVAIANWFTQLLSGWGIEFGPRSRLFFYSARDGHPKAAVAKVQPFSFQLLRQFPHDDFMRYNLVTSAASHGKNWIFFHYKDDESGEIGIITGQNLYVRYKAYPPGTLPSTAFAAVDGAGVLLLVHDARELEPGQTKVTLVEVLPDGTLFLGWSQVLNIQAPDGLRGGASLVGLPNGHAWLTSEIDSSTIYVLDNGGVATSRTWNVDWRGMVFHKGALLLWDSRGNGEICKIDENKELVTTATGLRFGGSYGHTWDHIASAESALFRYSYGGARGDLCTLTPTALTVHAHVPTYEYWSFIVAC